MGRRRDRFFLELALVLVIVGILIAVATPRVLGLRAEIERIAVERAIADLSAVARLEHARLLMAGEGARIAELDGDNPVLLWLRHLDRPLLGYDPEPAPPVAPGTWYFDAEAGALIYRVRAAGRFETDGPLADSVRLRLSVDRGTGKGRGRVQIERLDQFTWQRSRLASAAGL